MALSQGYRKNFNTLLRAARSGDLALIECSDAKTGECRAVLCAVQRGADGTTTMVPFGHLSPGNPYEDYVPPPS